MTYHLTEKECEELRGQLNNLADPKLPQACFDIAMKAVRLLDEARSKSFRARLAKRYRKPALF